LEEEEQHKGGYDVSEDDNEGYIFFIQVQFVKEEQVDLA
jgi:hypothetical protein